MDEHICLLDAFQLEFNLDQEQKGACSIPFSSNGFRWPMRSKRSRLPMKTAYFE